MPSRAARLLAMVLLGLAALLLSMGDPDAEEIRHGAEQLDEDEAHEAEELKRRIARIADRRRLAGTATGPAAEGAD